MSSATTRAAHALRLLCVMLGLHEVARAGSDDIFRSGFESLPIVAPVDTWTWVPFADAFCGNNSSTGIGINQSSTGNRVLVFLNGGGACWDATTCITLQTAANFNTGFGPNEFNALLPALGSSFFDRTSATNPFRNYHYVFVPYCTGDLHFGNTPAISYAGNPRSHLGYRNLGAFLERIRATFPTTARVYLAGSSGGGFGAALNWTRVQQFYGNTRVDMIDDSGQFMPSAIVPPTNSNEMLRFANWNLASTLPAGCSSCFSDGLDHIYTYNATTLPNNRGALLSYRPDPTIANFYLISTTSFTTGLNLVLANRWDPFPSKRYFIVGSSGHALLSSLSVASNGVLLEAFLAGMVSDDPTWGNVTPP